MCICGGTVSIPKGRRNLTLEQVAENHRVSCPRGGTAFHVERDGKSAPTTPKKRKRKST